MDPEREIKKLLKEFLQLNENIILSEKFFVAASVLNWAILKYRDKEQLNYYLNLVKEHIKGQIVLYWDDGVVKIKRGIV